VDEVCPVFGSCSPSSFCRPSWSASAEERAVSVATPLVSAELRAPHSAQQEDSEALQT
jgi:hypothetical protein